MIDGLVLQNLVVQTELFPTAPEGDLDLCNGQPGSAFANWLKEKLSEKGYSCDSLIQEDYGWGFWINIDGATIWVSVSYAPGDESAKGEWFVSANHEIPFLLFQPWKWGKSKSGKLDEERVYRSLKEAIEACGDAIKILREEA